MEGVSLFRDKLYENKKALKNDPNNDELKKGRGKLENSVKYLKAANEKIAALGKSYTEMLAKDEISGVDEEEFTDLLESAERGDIKVHLDGGNNMSFLHYKDDKNGNSKLFSANSIEELMKKNPIKRVDVDTKLDDFVKTIGRDKIDEVSGMFIKGSDVFGKPQEDFANNYIDGILGTGEDTLQTNDTLADLLNQATNGSSKKKKDFTQEERVQIKDWLINKIKGRFNEEKSLQSRPIQQQQTKTAAEKNMPIADDVNMSFSGDDFQSDAKGNVVFTSRKNIVVSAAKSDMAIDTFKLGSDGQTMIASGEDRIKVKGVQGESEQDVADREGVPLNRIKMELMGGNNAVQFYKIEKFSTEEMSEEEATRLLNKIGNMMNVNDSRGLRQILRDNMVKNGFDPDKMESKVKPTPPAEVEADTKPKGIKR